MNQGIVWRPDAETVGRSNLRRFMDRHGIADYEALVKRADADPEWFWDATIRFLDIRFVTPYEKVRDLSKGAPWAEWCVGGTTNLTLSTLDKHRGTPTEAKVAIRWEGETGTVRQWTYAELDRETCRLAAGLKGLGIRPGDAIGIFMPMLPETVAAFYAAARVGAITVPLFSGFGPEAIIARLTDAEAKLAITVDASRRRGQVVPMKATMDQVAERVPTLKHVLVLNTMGEPVALRPGRDLDWHELAARQPDRIEAEAVPSEHPLLLVYTSGTTGRPKGTVLTHCGLPTKISADFQLNLDVRPDDRFLWITDFGWVVGPALFVSATVAGASMVLVEGGPDFPDTGRMWRLVQEHKATYLGVAPTSVRTLMRYGAETVAKYDLSSLRGTASTGEPWTEEAWLWFFEHVCRRRVPIINWSGGTEIGGGIICGTMIHPLKPCSFAGPMPAMGADIVDEQGASVGPNQVGELVLRTPSIGLARGLWKDPERYIETYWSMFPGLWRHGDWASRDGDGMWYIHGRSDDTLKISGKRTGPAEIEGIVMATGKVSEAAAIGIPDAIKGEAVACVCVPAPGIAADETLRQELAEAVTRGFGRSFRPQRILFVADLPKTRSLKIMRRVVKALVLGKPPGDLSALSNPEALDEVKRAAGQTD
ncbi:MAG: AMP-binding protein [Alphaproteobacteria bacterium]|nr:AMP-binding protein [Alphaproteobacteria bacterium]